MLALVTTRPMNGRPRELAVATHVNGHTFHQAAHDLLPIDVGCARSIPQGRDIGSEGGNACPFLWAQADGRLPEEAVVLFLELLFLGEQLLPAFFQGGRHQAVLGIDRLVAALRQLHVVTRTLAPLLPVLVEAIAFLLDIRMSLDAQFHSGRFERAQDLLSDQTIQCPRYQPRTTQLRGTEILTVASVLGLSVGEIESPHSSAASTADQGPRKERDTRARSTLAVELIPVLLDPLPVLQIPLPADVRGQTI